MSAHPHTCPQCGHVGPPAGRLGASSWFYLIVLAGWLAAVAYISDYALAIAMARAGIAAGSAAADRLTWISYATVALAALSLLLGAWLNRTPVCAACHWRHTRPASPAEIAAAQ